MDRARPQTKAHIDDFDGGYGCLSIESLQNKTTFELDCTVRIMAAYCFPTLDVPSKDSPFGKSVSEVEAEPRSRFPARN